MPTDINEVAIAVAWAAFWLIVVTLLVTWIVQVLLRPQTRMEWAEFRKISAFLLIVLRTAWTLITGKILPPIVAVVFWVVCFILIFSYLWVILDDWGPPFLNAVYGFGVRGRSTRWWTVALLLLLVVTALTYVLLFA